MSLAISITSLLVGTFAYIAADQPTNSLDRLINLIILSMMIFGWIASVLHFI